MPKHRALCIGAGRIGAGYNWMQTPYCYTHAEAYLALKDRVELLGFVEPDGDRAFTAQKKYGVPVWEHLEDALDAAKPDVVSICTQPEERAQIIDRLTEECPSVVGIWAEKPIGIKGPYYRLKPHHIVVNYWRRFEPMHRRIKDRLDAGELGEVVALTVAAKKDVHTVCHFTNLALWWGVPPAKFHYVGIDGTEYQSAEYTLYTTTRVLRFEAGGAMMTEDAAQESHIFPGLKLPMKKDSRAWSPIFMEEALSDLLNVMDGVSLNVKSPPESACEAERWADEILKGNA